MSDAQGGDSENESREGRDTDQDSFVRIFFVAVVVVIGTFRSDYQYDFRNLIQLRS